MLKAASCLLGGLLLVSSPAFAGLFSDDDARKQIQQLEARVIKLEQQLAEAELQNKLSVRSILDLQMQLEMQATELRKQRGEFEEIGHALQEGEKRQKNFYTDLDSRLRPLEAGTTGNVARVTQDSAGGSDPMGENRAFETAYGIYRAEKYPEAARAFSDFLRQYPQSMHEANVYYWMGNAHFLSRDYANAVAAYRFLLDKHDDHPRAPESMLNLAESQLLLKQKANAQKTFKQLIARFPGSDASDKAKKRLATIK
ncbi:tol-pal system protein YbgF [Ferrigenium sp. UT5]|uniref:tol-pal system protein YbgF n=1 Tax=Ferrigenium sp. UT5 TaxID=3242105 RepID=UPI00354E4DEC